MSAEQSKSVGSAISIKGVVKEFTRGGQTLRVLDSLDLHVPEGSFEALMGPSGSGKSTLLNLIAGLDKPTSGEITVAGPSATDEYFARTEATRMAKIRERISAREERIVPPRRKRAIDRPTAFGAQLADLSTAQVIAAPITGKESMLLLRFMD